MRLTQVVVAAGLLVAGCASGHAHHPAGPRLVPWDASVPAALRARTGPPAPPCRAAQLRAVAPGFRFEPALSGGTGTVTLRNAGPATCRLTGRPAVRLVGASPAPAQRQQSLPALAPAFPHVLQPASTLDALPAGGTATLSVDWRNWCIPAGARRPTPPEAMRLTLPGGRGSLDVGYDAVPSCDTRGAPSTVGVRPFQPAELPAAPPWTTSAVTATIQPLDGKAVTGRPGETVGFAVMLHNPSTAPARIDHCPLLVEMLAPAGTPEVHQLDCSGGAIPANGSIGFEMRIRVPRDAPAGNNGLFWELDPSGAQGPEAVSRLVVAR